MRRARLITGLLASAAALPAMAHHSGVMFDMSKLSTIEGTVKDFQWTNPHSWLLIEVPGADGSPAIWSFEAGPPTILMRMGVKRSDFVPGEKIEVHAWKMKDSSPAGLLQSVTRADGSKIDVAALDKDNKDAAQK